MKVILLVVVLALAVVLGAWFKGLLVARKSAPGLPKAEVDRDTSTSGRHSKGGAGPRVTPPQSIDLDELAQWVKRNLPPDIQPGLEVETIRRIVEWNLDFIRSKRASSNGHSTKPATQVVVAGAETAEYVLNRSSEVGLGLTPAQVHAVLDAQMAYLESMGAAGPEIGPDPSGPS